MRIGAKVPNNGPLPAERGIAAMAAALEGVGFESLWVSDHLVMPTEIRSRYPFAADGRPTWPADTPYYDCLVAMAAIATATERAAIATAVLVLPLRHPVVLAKQVASLDAMSGGRVVLGVGAGWLAEEFEALGVPFGDRMARTEEWVDVLRTCWRGRVAGLVGERCAVPNEVMVVPTPAHDVPVLIGGHGKRSLRMAGGVGDGWLAHQSALALDVGELAAGVAAVRTASLDVGKDPVRLRTVLRVIDSANRPEAVANMLPALFAAGVDEVVVDVDWSVAEGPKRAFEVLEAARGETRS